MFPAQFNTQIQDDSGGKVNTLGGSSTGHCEKKSSHEHVFKVWMVTKIALFEATNTKTLLMIIKKEKLMPVIWILI
jgi:hypothetical protein